MRPDLHGKRDRVLALLKTGLTIPQLRERLGGDASGVVKRLVDEGKVECVEVTDRGARVWRAVETR
jgi:hypothetical protein